MSSFRTFLNKLKDEDKRIIEFTKEELDIILQALDVSCSNDYFYEKEEDKILGSVLDKICNVAENED